jgi:hypothetical protein
MHTGQNSIAPESSLPQLGQVRLSSVFMVLTAFSRKQRYASASGAKSAGIAPGIPFSRCTSNCVFRDISASIHVSEEN